MNIVFLQTSAKDCGPTNQLKAKLKALQKYDQIEVLTVFLLKTTPYETVNDNIFHIIGLMRFIQLILFRRKNLIIHSSGFLPDLLNSFISIIFQTISTTTVRCEFASDYTSAYGRIIGSLLANIHSLTLPLFSRVICCSESINSYLIKKYSCCNAITINNCCTIDGGSSDDSCMYSITGSLKFLTCAPLIERKNILKTIDLLRLYSESLNIPITYTIYGKGPLYQSIKSLNCDFVRLEGFVNQDSIKYSDFNVYISLSQSEGFSNSLLEASFHGLHLVLSTLPSHFELARYYPNVTFVDNSQSLLALNLFENIKRPSNQFLARHRDRISPETMTRKYLAIWNDLLF
jgi:hypothetical protein